MTYRATAAETLMFKGPNGDQGEAYYARPTAPGKYPGVVLIHHMPGWDEWITEAVRKLALHGFATISPHLYFREGPGTPDDLAAKARDKGGVSDAQVVGDVAGAAAFLRARPESNGKVGVIGFCSGGRHAYLAACKLPKEINACVNCWGGNVVVDDPKLLNEMRPVAPIEMTNDLACPVLGLFGNDDQNPNRDHVNRLEEALKKAGKNYDFHRYDGCGHAFFNAARVAYRPEQAADGWAKVMAFYNKHLK
jgi:carboxymethylenebutenolidase